MVQCPTHGLEHIITSCAHIADAIDRAGQAAPHVALDDWGTPSLVCEACLQRIAASPRTLGERHIGFDHVLATAEVPHCIECTRAWFATATDGELSAAIAAVRSA